MAVKFNNMEKSYIIVEKLDNGYIVTVKNKTTAIENEESLRKHLGEMIFGALVSNKNIRDFSISFERNANLPKTI